MKLDYSESVYEIWNVIFANTNCKAFVIEQVLIRQVDSILIKETFNGKKNRHFRNVNNAVSSRYIYLNNDWDTSL